MSEGNNNCFINNTDARQWIPDRAVAMDLKCYSHFEEVSEKYGAEVLSATITNLSFLMLELRVAPNCMQC